MRPWRIAFVGRPNVGKSTLVNRLLGEERMIARLACLATTRDLSWTDPSGQRVRLVDTAGIRRSRIEEVVEKLSVAATLDMAIEEWPGRRWSWMPPSAS